VGELGQSRAGPDVGKFVLVLRKAADGRWLIAADIDNLNVRPSRPAPQAASAASRPWCVRPAFSVQRGGNGVSPGPATGTKTTFCGSPNVRQHMQA
jgi:hypothetical protein